MACGAGSSSRVVAHKLTSTSRLVVDFLRLFSFLSLPLPAPCAPHALYPSSFLFSRPCSFSVRKHPSCPIKPDPPPAVFLPQHQHQAHPPQTRKNHFESSHDPTPVVPKKIRKTVFKSMCKGKLWNINWHAIYVACGRHRCTHTHTSYFV